MIADIAENRPLTPEEYALTRWMLTHGGPESARYLDDLERARVVSRCGCGCASVDFSVDGREPARDAPLRVVADFEWRDAAGRVAAVAAFVREGRLAGLELSCLDPDAAIDHLPVPEKLRPFGNTPAT